MGSQRSQAGRRGGKRQRRTGEIRRERQARLQAGQERREKIPRDFLMVGGEVFQVLPGHEHREVEGLRRYADCATVVTIRRYGARGRLRMVFRNGPGRLVSDGFFVDGMVVGAPDGRFLNLAEPGTQLAVLDGARKGGWQPDDPSPHEIDGWTLFDAVAASRNRNSYE